MPVVMEIIADVARLGNQNAITDACVAMMAARSAVLGALLNVRINLGSLKDKTFVDGEAGSRPFGTIGMHA